MQVQSAVAPASTRTAPASTAPASAFTVGEFNVDNFFPPGPNNAGDVSVTPQQYSTKLSKLAVAINTQLKQPDVLALEEVGSQQSLDDLLAKTDLGSEGYKGIMLPTNDKRGINVALLYKPTAVAIDSTNELTPDASNDPQIQNGSGGEIDPSKLFARPPLAVNLTVLGTNGSTDAANGARQVELVVNHLLAKIGGPKADPRRNAEGTFLGNYADQQEQADPQRGVIVLGDFNSGYGEGAYNAMTTRPDGSQRLYDAPALKMPKSQQYTYDYRGERDMLDHVLVTQNLKDAVTGAAIPHFDSDDHWQHENDATVANGVSDHDPILATFNLTKLAGQPA